MLKRVNELTKGRSLQASIHFFLLDLYCLNIIIIKLQSPSKIQVPHDHGCSMYLQHIHAIKGRSQFNFRGISLLYLNFKTWGSAVHLPLLPMGIWWYSTSTNGLINAQEIYLILWGQLGVFNRKQGLKERGSYSHNTVTSLTELMCFQQKDYLKEFKNSRISTLSIDTSRPSRDPYYSSKSQIRVIEWNDFTPFC